MMNSMAELNGYGQQSQIFSDDRATSVTFSDKTSPVILYKPNANATVSLPNGIDILTAQSIPDTSNLVIDTNSDNISISWATVPSSCTVGNVPGNDHTYKIEGPLVVSIWNQVKNPTVTFSPSDYRQEGLMQAELNIGNVQQTYSIAIEYEPLITANFYTLDSSGNYTGNVPVTDIYYNQFPYLDIIAEGTGASTGNNKITSLSVNWTSNWINNAQIYPILPENITAPTGGVGNRYENYYERTSFTSPVTSTCGYQTANITATSQGGRTSTVSKTVRMFDDYLDFSIQPQSDWTNPTFTSSGGLDKRTWQAGYLTTVDGNLTATTANNVITCNYTADLDFEVRHYPQFNYHAKNLIMKSIYLSWNSSNWLLYPVQNDDYTYGNDGLAAFNDTALSVTLNGQTLLSKTVGGNLTFPHPTILDVTNFFTDTTSQHPATVVQTVPDFQFSWSTNNANSYILYSSSMSLTMTFEECQTYNYVASQAGYGPSITPQFYHGLNERRFNVIWKKP